MNDHWKTLISQKQQECTEKTPPEWRLSRELLDLAAPKGVNLLSLDLPRRSAILSESELELTERYSATELLAKLAVGEVKSEDVTRAFCKRAAIAQQVTSCLTETFYPQALERARSLDTHLRETGKPIGPLHGLPVSIKDSFNVKGLQATIGFVSYLKQEPAKTNSTLVDLLLDLGAVLYVKTNIPQTLMTADSENNIFGRTLNPHNTALTAGGSSGGEGALVAFRGSILGVGTDIAGSIRIPSLCCGVYGFKPSVDRIPYGGGAPVGVMEGLPGLKPSAGPLAHNLDDLELFMRTVLGGQPWKYDSNAFPVPWLSSPPSHGEGERGEEKKTTLTIGVLPETPHFPLHPPVRRTLLSTLSSLSQKGHKIVHLPDSPERDIAYMSRLAMQSFIYAPHDKENDPLAISGEPQVASVASFANPFFSGPLPVSTEGLDPFHTIEELHKARSAVVDAWRKVWVESGLDAVVVPGAQNTAVPHDTYGWPPYTVMWNVLDYPAAIIPHGKSSKDLDPDVFQPGNAQANYDPAVLHGAPCAIQVVTPKFQDEKCLAVAKVIDRDIRE